MPSELLQNRMEIPPQQMAGPKIPWKGILQSAGAAAAGTGLGYIGGGIITHGLLEALPEGALAHWWTNLPPATQKLYVGTLGGIAAGVGTAAYLAQRSASSAHMMDAAEELNRPPDKEAMVRDAYRSVLG